MNTIALAHLAADAAAVAPVASDGMGGWLGIVVQLGCFGLIAYLVWYFTARYLPERERREQEEREKRDELFAASLKTVTDDSTANRATYELTMEKYRHEGRNREQALVGQLAEKDRLLIDVLRDRRDASGPLRVQT